MIERTHLRPRDILQFVNESLSNAYGKDRLTWNMIYDSEAEYSRKRMHSLVNEEWADIFPSLKETIKLLREKNESFCWLELKENNNIDDEIFEKLSEKKSTDPVINKIKDYLSNKKSNWDEIYFEILRSFYQVGIIGFKLNKGDSFIWSFKDKQLIENNEICTSERIRVHKMLHRALNINTSDKHNNCNE